MARKRSAGSRAAPKTEPKVEPKKAEQEAGPTGRPGAARTDVPPDQEEKREPAKRTTKAKAGAWLGSSNLKPRFGQSFNVSWRASEPVRLREESAAGTYLYPVDQRGSKQIMATVAGLHVFTLRAVSAEGDNELARLELNVRT